MAQIEIPEEEMANLLSAQVLASLSQETKETLIQSALKFLLTPKRDYPHNGETPLQTAFDQAVRRMANDVADEVLKEQGLDEKIKMELGKLVATMPEVFDDEKVRASIMDLVFAKAKEFYNSADRSVY